MLQLSHIHVDTGILLTHVLVNVRGSSGEPFRLSQFFAGLLFIVWRLNS